MAKTNLTIDREFQHVLPPLADEELRHLEEAIKQDGCEVAIIYWENSPNKDNPIIDGMNRFHICQRHKLPYPTMGRKFPDRAAVIRWIRVRQLGRRNLTDAARTVLRGQLYRELKGEPHRPQSTTPTGEKLLHDATVNSVAELAASEGVDRGTLIRAEKAAAAVESVQEKSPAVAAAIMSEAIPMNAAVALADATKAELKHVAAAVKTGDKKAIRDAVKEITAPEPEPSADGAPWEEAEEECPITAFLTACNTDKIKATKEQRKAFGEFDDDLQKDLLKSILAGRQTLSNAISTGEVAPQTIDERVKSEAGLIEADCRELRTLFDAIMKKPHNNNVWANDLNRRGGAIQKFKDLLENIRAWKPAEPCPRCKPDNEGCKDCRKTGMVTRNQYQALT